jgi:hypothetical protein
MAHPSIPAARPPDATDLRERAVAVPSRRKTPRNVAIVLVAGVILSVGTVYLLRDAIASAVAGYVLEHQANVTCNHPQIHLGRSLRAATISQLECTVHNSRITHLRTKGDSVVELDGLHIVSATAHAASLDQRDRDVSNAKADFALSLGKAVGLADALMKGMLDAAQNYSADSPLIATDQLTETRGGKPESTLYGYTQRMDGAWNVTRARSVESGVGGIELRNFEQRVTSKRGRLSLDIYFGKPEPHQKPDLRVVVTGDRLDTDSPSFAAQL